ncbi:hypothetical protein GAY31_08325 [Azospirillum brasilense]|nr:hypothetical protein [Azospirillum brasilense]
MRGYRTGAATGWGVRDGERAGGGAAGGGGGGRGGGGGGEPAGGGGGRSAPAPRHAGGDGALGNAQSSPCPWASAGPVGAAAAGFPAPTSVRSRT